MIEPHVKWGSEPHAKWGSLYGKIISRLATTSRSLSHYRPPPTRRLGDQGGYLSMRERGWYGKMGLTSARVSIFGDFAD